MFKHIALIVLFGFLLAPAHASAQAIRLFILSGQSNMHGLDPDLSFTPELKKAFPGDEIIVVKHAVNGQLIRAWDRDWQPPAGEDAGKMKNGGAYKTLLKLAKSAIEGKAAPASVTFVWMQGEADAREKGYDDIYAGALQRIVEQLQADLGRKDLNVILGRLSDYGNKLPEERPGWNHIRQIQMDFASHYSRGAWVDTDDLNGEKNDLHYGPDGYKTLGQRFAQSAIELIRNNGKKPEPTTQP